MPFIRQDPITRERVIFAEERGNRPVDFADVSRRGPQASFCPFCLGNENTTPSAIGSWTVPDSANPWDVRVIPNKFPALRVEGEFIGDQSGLLRQTTGIGAHEIFIESCSHKTDFHALSVDQMELVLMSWADRIRDLEGDQRLATSVVFKNHGARSGATVDHVHSQLLALPVVPERLGRKIRACQEQAEMNDINLYQAVLEKELSEDQRVIYQNDDVAVIAPYASRVPFEMMMFPKVSQPRFESSQSTFRSVAQALRDVLTRLHRALDNPPFNLTLSSAPYSRNGGYDNKAVEHFCWTLEIIPGLTSHAGFEWATGAFINPTTPEDAAQHLREIDL
jgi:UDPglucose--hexose-1-phosphate uridylyltransferase